MKLLIVLIFVAVASSVPVVEGEDAKAIKLNDLGIENVIEEVEESELANKFLPMISGLLGNILPGIGDVIENVEESGLVEKILPMISGLLENVPGIGNIIEKIKEGELTDLIPMLTSGKLGDIVEKIINKIEESPLVQEKILPLIRRFEAGRQALSKAEGMIKAFRLARLFGNILSEPEPKPEAVKPKSESSEAKPGTGVKSIESVAKVVPAKEAKGPKEPKEPAKVSKVPAAKKTPKDAIAEYERKLDAILRDIRSSI